MYESTSANMKDEVETMSNSLWTTTERGGIRKSKVPWILAGIAMTTAIIIWGVMTQKEPISTVEPPLSETEEMNNTQIKQQDKLSATEWMVDVKGAVKKPGVYTVTQGERVIDVIEKAGGLTVEANQKSLSLAQYVTDEMSVYVPKIGEIVEEREGESPIGSGRISLNTATVEELDTLQGIGPVKAEAIVEYRETNGLFRSLEDLLQVNGIGEKTIEQIQNDVLVP